MSRRAVRVLLAVSALCQLVALPADAQSPVASNAGRNWSRVAAEAYVERAEAAQRRGDTAQAITAYMRAVRADSTFGRAYFGLSEIRRAAGDLREAELLLNRALAFPDTRAEALSRRSAVYSAAGKDDLALRDLEAAAAVEPTPQRLQSLAGAYAQKRSWVAALSVYRRLRESEREMIGSERTETDETVAALAALAAEADAPQHDAAERNWVRRALRRIALRLDRRLFALTQPN